MAATGFAKALDLEPGMLFRRRADQDPHEFLRLDPAGAAAGRRRVRVVTAGGHSFPCDWDHLLILAEEPR